MRCESHASVFCIRASSTPSTRGCSASASASTRVLVHVHANSLSWVGVESALSGRGENAFGRLGESAGARLRGRGEARRERGGSESAESLVVWRLRGLEGRVESRVRTVYAHARCGRRGRGRRARVSSAASDRALACDSRARSEALASARGKCASDSSSTHECKPSHTRVIRSRVLPYL